MVLFYRYQWLYEYKKHVSKGGVQGHKPKKNNSFINKIFVFAAWIEFSLLIDAV